MVRRVTVGRLEMATVETVASVVMATIDVICVVLTRDWSYQWSPLIRRGSSFNASAAAHGGVEASPAAATGVDRRPTGGDSSGGGGGGAKASKSASFSQKAAPRRLSWFASPLPADAAGAAGGKQFRHGKLSKARTLSIDRSGGGGGGEDGRPPTPPTPTLPPAPPSTPTAHAAAGADSTATHFRVLNSLRTSFRRNSFLRNRKDVA